MTERLLAAAGTGDIEALLPVLSPEMTLVTDGGGIRKAALRPIHGAEKVARWFIGVPARPDVEGLEAHVSTVNGELAIVTTSVDGVDAVMFLTVEGEQVTAMHVIRNPEKLTAVVRPTP